MYDDMEVEKIYMGAPLEDTTRHLYGGFVDLITFSDEEAMRLFLGLPLISTLTNVRCEVRKG